MVIEVVRIFKVEDLEFDLDSNLDIALTIGNFDGLHVGHKELIFRLIDVAKEKDLVPCVMTFEPHPAEILAGIKENFYISSLEEKISNLEKIGVKRIYLFNFNLDFARVSAEEFLIKYLRKLSLKYLLVGEGFLFGSGRQGNIERLKIFAVENGFIADEYKTIKNKLIYNVNDINNDESADKKISSRILRDELKKGNLEEFKLLKGENYKFFGEVIHGDGRGKKIGFPTINVNYDKKKILPRLGVYGVKVLIEDKIYFGIMNVGLRPSFSLEKKHSVEVNVFDLNEDIYGKIVEIELVFFVRDEIKFDSVDFLVEQINKDINFVKRKFDIDLMS